MDYQWYPGHMTKARRRMQENLKLVDLIIELTDARTPLSGRNPDIDSLAAGKKRILILTKADLADEALTRRWVEYFQDKGILAAAMDARKSGSMRQIRSLVAKAAEEKMERDRRRGIRNRPVRAMIVGIPNVGKSTFINSYAGRASAKTGNKPGVTRGEQWIRPDNTLELLDTPGILWPKFEDPQVGIRLALTGTIRDELLQTQELSGHLITFLEKEYPGALNMRYGIGTRQESEGESKETAMPDAPEILREVAEARKLIASGGEWDMQRAAAMLIDEFRSGALGRFTLEQPPE